MIWTAVEPGVYHIAACLPTLRPLVTHLTRGISMMIKSRRTRAYGSHSAFRAKDIQLAGRDDAASSSAARFVHLGSGADEEIGSYAAKVEGTTSKSSEDEVGGLGISHRDLGAKDNRCIIVTQDNTVSNTR